MDGGGGPPSPPTRPSAQDDAPAGGDADEGGEGGAGNATDATNATNGTDDGGNLTTPPEGLEPSLEVELALEPVVGDLSRPVGFVQAGDGSNRWYVVQQGGLVRVLEADGSLRDQPFLDLRSDVSKGSEQGLLSIAFPPVPDGRVYVSYTDTDGRSVLARYQVEDGGDPVVDQASKEVLLTVDQPFANHNGGLILFGPDGHLWYALGDGGSAGDPLNNGQNTETLLGSLLRLDVSGDSGYEVPADNPFVGGAGRDEIYHYGLRNPWRFSFDRESGMLFVADVGQNEIEEVNAVPIGAAGLNFGWDFWEGSQRYSGGSAEGELVFPVAEYAHSESGGCSVTGGHVYRGASVPELRGVYLYGDYCSGDIWGLLQDAEGWQTRRVLDTDLRITSFAQDLSGEVYVVDHEGSIQRIVAA